jgi:hypothetical protein
MSFSGPQHWREADLILTGDDPCSYGCPHNGCPHEMAMIARAQVHATLALAAATALIDEKPRSGSFDAWREWNQVAGRADYPAVTP